MNTSTRHWSSRRDSDGICWLTLDRPDASANSLSAGVMSELDDLLGELQSDLPTGVVFQSGKNNGFILGADINEFTKLESQQQALQLVRTGQQIINRIEQLACPTVALIQGYAMGGGLELAMACDYRVALLSHERTLGLPEIQLGLHPGFGGTVRAIRLAGAPAALDLMLTGRSVSSIRGKAIGLIDAAVAREELEDAARGFVARRPGRHQAPWYLRLLTLPVIRAFLANQVEKQVRKRARMDHYPAPYALMRLFRNFGGRGEHAYEAEAESISKLFLTATSRNLVRVFFLRERLRGSADKGKQVGHLHVVGAGLMGGDIAAWATAKGLRVSLQDRASEYVERALNRASEYFKRRLKGPGEAQAAMDRLTMDLEAESVDDADVVLEAIFENLDAKKALFADLEPRMKTDALLASNTSSIRLELLAEGLARPDRLVGIHFFNPVAKLPLVEVIRSEGTGDEAFSRAVQFVAQIGKLPLPCKSSPGFLVNRILAPYMLEAMYAREEGISLETIDAAAEAFGMPVGPVELADRVGLDVANHVAEILGEAFGRKPPGLLTTMIEAGHLGAKSGQGFYRYENGKAMKERDVAAAPGDLEDRLILVLINEAVACLAEGVVEDADLVDAGVIFGTGFAPFTGGPIQHARHRGVGEIRQRLDALAATYGPRFTPHAGWSLLEES